MKILLATLTAAAALSCAPVLAQTAGDETHSEARGDPENGMTLFTRQCATCHVVADDDGEIIAGRPTQAGPNLYGVVGSAPGTRHEFRYGDALVEYGETGVVWERENLDSYLDDPTAHLRAALDDPRARSRMVFRIRNEEHKHDIIAFLEQYAEEQVEVTDENGAGTDEG